MFAVVWLTPRAKWRLWHGRWPGCRRKLMALCRWAQRKPLRDVTGTGRFQRHVSDLLGYLDGSFSFRASVTAGIGKERPAYAACRMVRTAVARRR